PIGTEGNQVKIAMLTGTTINVRMVPRIERNVFLQVRTVPVVETRRPDLQGLEAFLSGWIPSDVQSEHVEDGLKFMDLVLGDHLLRFFHVPEHAGTNQREKHGDDGHDDKQFDKRYSAISARFNTH